jgi:hypothetical protein
LLETKWNYSEIIVRKNYKIARKTVDRESNYLITAAEACLSEL